MHRVVYHIYDICCIMRAVYTTILVKNVDTIVSILFFHEYCCVDCPHYTTYIL
jgi:hypothetical protein